MEVFPDLHHKMSKKIAQLTKVIYHLNTKNEDHQTELEVMSSNHQAEIQQILRDAASRIAKFKETIESKQTSVDTYSILQYIMPRVTLTFIYCNDDQMNQDARLEKLMKKHESEKEAALKELNHFKSKMGDRDHKIAQAFQKKLDGLRGDLEAANKRFLERMEQFEAANKELRRSLEESSRSGAAGMSDVRKRYESEIAELVRTNNEKFQHMLLEQLQAQTDLRKEMEDRLVALKARLEGQFSKDLEAELGRERARLNGDKQEALMALRRELEDMMNKQRTDLEGSVDRLSAQVRSKTEECGRVQSSADQAIADLNRKIKQLQQTLSDQLGGQEILAQSLHNDLKAAKEQLSSVQAKVVQRDEELDAMRGLLSEKNAQLVGLEDKLRAAEGEAMRLRGEIDRLLKAGSSSVEDLTQRLQTASKEAESYRAEINQIAASMAAVREEMRRAEKGALRAAQEAEKTIEGLKSDKELLQNKVQELRLQLASASKEAGLELDTMTQTHLQQLELLKKDHSKALEDSAQQLVRAKENHRLESESSAAAKQALLDDMRSRERQWEDDRNALEGKHRTSTAALEQQHSLLVEEMAARHDVEAKTLKASLSAVEGQLQSLSEQADGERNALRGEVSKWEGKARGLQKELEHRKKENERAESVTTGLKNQVESLREELKASQKAFLDKMGMSQAKLEAEWQARLDAQQEASDAALDGLRAALSQEHAQDLQRLMTSHNDDMLSLKALLQKEQNTSAKELADYEKLRLQLESELKAAQLAHVSEVSELNKTHAAHCREVEDRHQQEIDKMRREGRSSAEAREKSLSEAHAMETQRLHQLVEGTVEEYTQRMAASLDAARAAADEALRKSLFDQETRLKRDRREELDALSREHADAVALLTARHAQEIAALSGRLGDSTKQCADASEQIAGLERTLSGERQERQRREEFFLLEKDQLERAHESDIRREKESSERKILEVMERAGSEMALTKQEHLEVRHLHDQRVQDMILQYKALEHRYFNRESREEDLQRIAQLMREMVEKDELVVKTREEMMYFKREMLNREENYNQKFGSSPHVGVMQVIKPKEMSSSSGGSGGGGPNGQKAKPTQMRAIPSNGHYGGGLDNNNNAAAMGQGFGVSGVAGRSKK